MRLVVQRVLSARVTIDGAVAGEIARGFMVLCGVRRGDTPQDAEWLARKTAQLRVFEDAEGKMNLPLASMDGGILVVSQFTLYGDCAKGNRPSFIDAAAPADGEALYERYVAGLRAAGLRVETGRFGANMQVELINDGPVTLIVESSGRLTL